MLIARIEPMLVLSYDGFLRVSYFQYNHSSTELMSHVTNTQLVKKMLKDSELSQQQKDEIAAKQMLSYEDLQDYLLSRNITKDRNYIASLRKQIKTAYLHISLMAKKYLLKHPGVFELFGMDFILDENLHLWYLEANRSPAMQATTKKKGDLQNQLIKQTMELEFLLHYGGDWEGYIAKSAFEVVYDETKTGERRYAGLVANECFEALEQEQQYLKFNDK